MPYLPLCESAKKGRVCCDDLCRSNPDETLCGFNQSEYERMIEDYSETEDWPEFDS